MTEGVKHGLIFFVMSAITIGFCLLFYPPIKEKLKNVTNRSCICDCFDGALTALLVVFGK